MITRDALVTEARSWAGTPYHHSARLKGVGVDCIGLVVGVGIALGIPEAELFANDVLFKGYSEQPDPLKLITACDKYLDRAKTYQPGDVLVMRFEREPQHFGLVTSVAPDYLIHSLALAGKVAEHSIDRTWARRIVRVYRFRGVA